MSELRKVPSKDRGSSRGLCGCGENFCERVLLHYLLHQLPHHLRVVTSPRLTRLLSPSPLQLLATAQGGGSGGGDEEGDDSAGQREDLSLISCDEQEQEKSERGNKHLLLVVLQRNLRAGEFHPGAVEQGKALFLRICKEGRMVRRDFHLLLSRLMLNPILEHLELKLPMRQLQRPCELSLVVLLHPVLPPPPAPRSHQHDVLDVFIPNAARQHKGHVGEHLLLCCVRGRGSQPHS
mmetsp:Transcript_34163/g.107026  ORF Transcript_34163/g.107026 Transcript_34163/m.107026 type:complete len:236 (+) Transcript_34163:1167-1874(+)